MQTKTHAAGKKRLGQTKMTEGSKRPRNATSSLQADEAWRILEQRGVLSGRADKISARIDHGLLRAAGRKLGTQNTTNILEAALATFVAPDPFVDWFLSGRDRLPADFEPGI